MWVYTIIIYSICERHVEAWERGEGLWDEKVYIEKLKKCMGYLHPVYLEHGLGPYFLNVMQHDSACNIDIN